MTPSSVNPTTPVLTVSDITDLISEILASIPELQDVWVQGELSNFKHHSSGHLYFTLKDEECQIPCVMFRYRANALRFRPGDGDQVLLNGKLSVYKRSGRYQIIVDQMHAAGVGALQQAFERLKLSLAEEGLFDEAHKKPLPPFPRRIGVITSPTGAAIRDILNILNRRFPGVEVRLYPVKVQGDQAAVQIATAIRDFNRWDNVDVLIAGRGGGSIEDLWAFNEEVVVRSIFASHIPVISAVGHEIDFTLSDYVADSRAPTPSAAAELAVPDQSEVMRRIEGLQRDLLNAVRTRLERSREQLRSSDQSLDPHRKLDAIRQHQQTLDILANRMNQSFVGKIDSLKQELRFAQTRLEHQSPRRQIQEIHREIERFQEQLRTLMTQRLTEYRTKLIRMKLKLDGLDHSRILRRGYGICLDPTGKPISSTRQVELGDIVEIQLNEGRLSCHVFQTHRD